MVEQSPSANGTKGKRGLILLTLVFVVVAIILACLYFFKWRYFISTEDAYVNGNQVQITAQISGTVAQINVQDTDNVHPGDILVALDKADAQVALNKAKSDLHQAVRDFYTHQAQVSEAEASVQQAQDAVGQSAAQLRAAEVSLQTAKADLKRRVALRNTNAISAEALQHAKDSVASAEAQWRAAQAAYKTAQSNVQAAQAAKQVALSALGKAADLRNQPDVQAGISEVQNAWLNLQRTDIRAPLAGQVAKRNVQLGQQISPGTPLMAVVPLQHLWVDANFKETQLRELKIGQEVDLVSDFYGDDVVFHGIIQGLSAGTGSAFSSLPAQNATGNWIKVIQRLPVRILLKPEELTKHPLKVGLTMQATVDIRDHENAPQVTGTVLPEPTATTAIQPRLEGANQVINDILAEH